MFSRKAKKVMSLTLVLTVLLSLPIAAPSQASVDMTGRQFYSAVVPQDVSAFITEMLPNIAQVIGSDLQGQGLYLNEVTVGTPISLNAEDEVFYFPLINNNQIVYLICVGRTGDPSSPFSLVYGKMFAEELNALSTYEPHMLVVNNESIYAVSESDTELLLPVSFDTLVQDEEIPEGGINSSIDSFQGVLNETDVTTFGLEAEGYSSFAEPGFDELNSVTLDLGDVSGVSVVDTNSAFDSLRLPLTRGVGGVKTIYLPVIRNGGVGGDNGYCWLACSYSIIQYYNPTFTAYHTLDSVHKLMHVGHELYYCPNGTLYDAMSVMLQAGIPYRAAGGPLAALSISNIIDGNQVIYAHLQSSTMAHDLVICGYIYSTSLTVFTLVVMDPNLGMVNVATDSNFPGLSINSNGSTLHWNVSIIAN